MTTIPLATRKVIKEAVAGFNEKLKEASELVGVTLTWEDKSTELYEAVIAGGADAASIKELPSYAGYMVDAFKELSNEELGKEVLTNIFSKNNGKVEFVIRDPTVSLSDYFSWNDSAFQIEIRSDGLGYWGGYYNADAIRTKATCEWNGHMVGLAQKKKLQEVEPQIAAAMKKASDAYGSEIRWDPDYSKLWSWLVETGDPGAKAQGLGDTILLYVEFFVDTFSKFIEDADNKEAIQGKMTTPRFGFRYLPSSHPDYVNWAWGDDGSLLLDVVGAAFGSWISESYYSLANLEATL